MTFFLCGRDGIDAREVLSGTQVDGTVVAVVA